MSDHNIVTQGRLVADWIRGLGFPAYAESVDALVKVVERLPVTADGVPVVPGMQLWHEDEAGRVAWSNPVVAVSDSAALWLASVGFQVTDVFYSTRAAALAAREGEL